MQHTNRLIHESSPYLLQHAHNPVNWYPWGEEALQLAKEKNLPILVSIGYSSCHWCHVMEKESFESADIAAIMNAYFVNIKVDREERPDLDHIYMDAVQTLTGSGGWPLNVFLTPDTKPFFGGTYFPPERAHNRMSWKEVLLAVHKAFTEQRDAVEQQAQQLTQHIKAANDFGLSTESVSAETNETIQAIEANILQTADTKWGGFGRAPKFPQTMVIRTLLRIYYHTHSEKALKQALLSIDKMVQGGIYDQIAGGFARYSTDTEWLVPHFEKMLYDNALLVELLAEAYQITHKSIYRQAMVNTIEWMEENLMDAKGGFYSAWDADSEGVEGKYYVWKKAEIEALLGEDAPIFCQFYGVTQSGNWEYGHNILWIKEPLEVFAEKNNLSVELLAQILEKGKQKLLAARSKRVKPGLDNKILPGWNALMIQALAKAYAATGIEAFKNRAIETMQVLENKFKHEQQWLHQPNTQRQALPAFLDDMAFVIQAYIALQEITGDASYLNKAELLSEQVMQDYSDEENLFFYFTSKLQQNVLVRKKELYDGATPSGNAVMAANLLYLASILDKPEWARRSRKMTASLMKPIVNYPTSFGYWALVVLQQSFPIKEVVFTGEEAQNFITPFLKNYIPDKIFQVSQNFKEGFPLLEGKDFNCKSTFYVCENYSCQKPEINFGNFFSQFQLNH
ncbi:thioredoxin domain-containing protein [Hydrotalea sandarakina]|jgi:uncharacterized protein YyaL (SSP411 family)|uniref:Spermatogenesis-associated protein 20-like TRX domain-containing protein n=1 Tax=Hydrotalea sandarakina TaxID=1004304 RepID=A0A2W7S5J3_9BACT|nr:thioredoxin domain-containing protein [Hydrotalea sandarakina]PZX62219.1 hypothetical protein LX80_01699 [Hydrotalea sandarakina]